MIFQKVFKSSIFCWRKFKQIINVHNPTFRSAQMMPCHSKCKPPLCGGVIATVFNASCGVAMRTASHLSPFISRAVYLTLISSLGDLSALKIDHKDPYSGIWARPFEGAKMVFRSQGGFFGTFSAPFLTF